MDYRKRKYYLIAVRSVDANKLDMLIKAIPKTKITKLESTNIPSNYSKIMVSCLHKDSTILENLITAWEKIFYKYNYYKNKLYIQELNKDNLGQ